MRLLSPALLLGLLLPLTGRTEEKPRPLLRDFMGLCVHTVQFRPELYAPVTRMVRDYHPFDWDVGKETDFATTFPLARNKVDWSRLYGSWMQAGYRVEASLQFDNFDPKAWRDLPRDAHAYGEAFARYFGPARANLLEAVEVGNEPGKYDDATYHTLFEAMARGLRAGDPRLRIATCAMNLGPSGRYSKSVDLLHGLDGLWDILNIHNYPEVEGWPTWRRSYPEDPKINFRRDIGHVLQWRAEHAPGKEVWLTEFGYDASTKPAPPTGDFAKWEGSTEEQQALWTVRAYLVLAATQLDRAYLYFFNDTDEAHVHGSSGLTRNFVPKPAYHAVAHLLRTLGGYRFVRTVRESAPEGFLYEFESGAEPHQQVLVAWKPEGAAIPLVLPAGIKVMKAERTPLTPGEPEALATEGLAMSAAPLFLWVAGP